MAHSKISFLLISSCALLATACSSSRFGGNEPAVQMPARLEAAPVGVVQQSDLPPPPSPAQPSAADDSQNTQVASLEPPLNALDLTPASVAGVWHATIGGVGCQIATPQTKFGQGYRAGPMRCPGVFSGVKSWAINGKVLSFYDASGSMIATLYSAQTGGFNGQTSNGQVVTLSR